MIVGRYSPGRHQAVVTGHGVVVLGPDVSPALAERVWEQAAGGRGLPAVLEALTGAFGTSLAAIPPFAVVLPEAAGVRVVVRGSIDIDVETPTGAETLSGAGVTTWTERSIPHARRASVAADQATGPAEYPVRDGIVLVSTIVIDFDETTDAAAPGAVDPGRAEPVSEEPVAAEPAPAEPVSAEPVAAEPAPAERAPAEPAPAESAPVEPALVASAPGRPQPAPPPAAPAPPGLIDSAAVLSMAGADTLLPADATFGHPVEAASAGAVDSAVAETIARPRAGDHDNETISLAEARRLRGVDADSAPPPLAAPRPPAPGRVRLSTGQVLLLDRTVVIGRRPRSTRVVGTDLPHLVAVDSPEQDISRSHLELRAEGDSIVATDLHTTNGTTLHRAGADPVRLHPGEATVVVAGDLLDLADGVTVTIEDLA